MVHAAIDRSLKALKPIMSMCIWFIGPIAQLRLMRQWRLLRKLCSRAKSVTLVYQTGLSNFTYDEIKTCMGLWRVDVLQYGCNLFNQRMAKWIFPYAQEHEIGITAYDLFAYRFLSGCSG